MKLKNLFFPLFLALSLLLSGCQSNNSETAADTAIENNTTGTTETDNTVDVNGSVSISFSGGLFTKELTVNSEVVSVEVLVFAADNSPYTEGSISIAYPDKVKTGVDVGSFASTKVNIVNGKAIFSYTAPKDLQARVDAGDISTVFGFYLTSTPATNKNFTFTYNPLINQQVLTDYALKQTSSSVDLSMNLNSSIQMSFYVEDNNGNQVDSAKMTSIKVKLNDPQLADIEDTFGNIGDELTFLAKNNVSLNVKTNSKSGILPITVTAIFTDSNAKTVTLNEVFNLVIFSGPPTAMSISYVSTANDKNTSKFKEKMSIALTDEYNNNVNTSPVVSVAMISGYASDTSGQLGYMYHRADSSIAGTLESGKFKVKSGVVTKVQMSSFGSGYSTAPLVSYAGGDGAFKANAVLAKTGSITNVTIVDGGSQYTKAPTVVAEGKGFGFVGKTILTSTGSFSAISLDNAGQGYITVPTVTPTGGGTGFLAEAVLEGSGSLKSVTIDKAGTGYAIGDELPVSGDGTGTIVKVSDVDAGGAILSVNILSKGSGYTDMGIDGTTTGGKNAAFTAIIGYKLKEIRLLNSGSGYVSGNLSITGGSADSAAVASGTLVYSIASVTITSGGYGYVSPSIVFTGDGVDAYAYATVKYGVDYVLVQNGGTNYTNGSLTFTSLDTGSGAAANAIVFDGAEFAATDALNYKLALFGEGYVYDATGFFDFTHVNATDNYELVLENQFDGVKTENLGFAIGNNYRQDPCKSGQEWVSVASFPNGSTFNSIGIAEVEISYDYYLAAKDVVIMANLVGQQNSIDQKVRFGEAIKHTFRGSGLVATSSSFNKGASYETHRLYITWNDTVEPLRNSRFTYTVKVVADGAVVHQIQDSMSFGIEECGVDSNGVKLEGRAYVDITISSPTSGGTISLENLLLVREFN